MKTVDTADGTPLHLAMSGDRYAISDEAGMVAELLSNGANPSATTIDGSQPLHLSRCNGSITRRLVE